MQVLMLIHHESSAPFPATTLCFSTGVNQKLTKFGGWLQELAL